MTIKPTLVAAATATFAAVGIASAPGASADTEVHYLGQQGELVNGDVVQGWTIAGLQPSTDTIPYPVAGTLWEATAIDEAISGTVTPIVSNLNARAESGQTYRVLFGVATPQGVNPATLAEGEKTMGKIYFDVTGDAPDSVVYNAGGPDLLLWVEAPPPATGPTGGYTTPAPVNAGPAEAEPEAAEGVPAPEATMTPQPAGSSGTPLPEGSSGTPLPEGSPSAAVPEDAAPAPAAAAATAPEGSAGTPLPEGAAPAEAPTGSSGTPLPEGQQAAPPAAEPAPVTTTVVAPPPA